MRYDHDLLDDVDVPRRGSWFRHGPAPILGRGRLVLALAMILILGLARLDPTPLRRLDHPAQVAHAFQTGWNGSSIAAGSGESQAAQVYSPGVHPAEDRLRILGQHLLRMIDPGATRGVSFHVDRQTRQPRSYVTEQGAIVVSESMLTALDRDAFLATVLAYEIGHVLQLRSKSMSLDLNQFAIQLLAQGGYDPRVIPSMSEWILGQTSVALAQPQPRDLVDFSARVQQTIARHYPQGLPATLTR
ncbi:MAG TPA: M48 family metalloprotease [Pirellulaceae bacterium]